jgi:hypothetical protein
MADMAAAVMGGPVRDWLAGQRAALNARFQSARRRFPALDGEAVLALCRELLPPLAGPDAAGGAELLAAVYDLILLHAGRGTLASGSGQPVAVLLRETFPALRPLLAARPRHLPGALSNAVENLGSRGIAFARNLVPLAPVLTRPEELLDAGAVLAWRLGDARLREPALERADRLPAAAVLAALGLRDWPAEAAPLVVTGLRANGWCRPEELFAAGTLAGLPRAAPDQLTRLRQEIAAPPAAGPASWRLAGRPGNFLGFDGAFDRPPLLLEPGAEPNAHRFDVRAGTAAFRLHADVFGWVCEPAGTTDARPSQAKRPARVKLPAGTTSLVVGPGAVAYTTADSFRVGVLAPPRDPL